MKNRRADSPMLELTLNLGPPRRPGGQEATLESPCAPPLSHESPYPSGGLNKATEAKVGFGYPSSPESNVATSMVLVGCPRCLMYVMLSEVNPKCPRCKSTVLLDFLGTDRYSAKKPPIMN